MNARCYTTWLADIRRPANQLIGLSLTLCTAVCLSVSAAASSSPSPFSRSARRKGNVWGFRPCHDAWVGELSFRAPSCKRPWEITRKQLASSAKMNVLTLVVLSPKKRGVLIMTGEFIDCCQRVQAWLVQLFSSFFFFFFFFGKCVNTYIRYKYQWYVSTVMRILIYAKQL